MMHLNKMTWPKYLQTAAALATSLLINLGCMQQSIAGGAEIISYPQHKKLDNFTLPDLNDNKHTLPDYQGKVILINFWASWCAPCVYEMPALKNLKQHFSDQPFEILALNVGENKYKVAKFTKLINFNLPVLLDSESNTFKDWGGDILPTSFLLDANGNVRYRIRGNPGWENDDSRSLITKLIADSANAAKLEQ